MEMQMAIGFMDETSALGIGPTQKGAVLGEGTIFRVSSVHSHDRGHGLAVEVGAVRPLLFCGGSGRGSL